MGLSVDGRDKEVLRASVLELQEKTGNLSPWTDCKLLAIDCIFYLLLIKISVLTQVDFRPQTSSTSNDISRGLHHLFLKVDAAFTNRVLLQRMESQRSC